MQAIENDELCVVQANESVLKVKWSMDKTKAASFEELPTAKKVQERIQQGDLDSSSVMYQSAELKRYDTGLEYMKFNYSMFNRWKLLRGAFCSD